MPVRDLQELMSAKRGLRVIGDVHGCSNAFASVVADARRNELAVLSLGDIVDRGPDSVGAMRIMMDLLETGDGEIVPGNHDDKLRRYLKGANVLVAPGSGLDDTIAELKASFDGYAVAQDFGAAISDRPMWLVAGGYVFVHAAFHLSMLDQVPGAPLHQKNRLGEVAFLALYGETDGTLEPNGKPVRTYRWLDTVPAGYTVVIGHDAVSFERPVLRTGALGGSAIHLDTGVDRGGRLSWIDIPREALLGRDPAPFKSASSTYPVAGDLAA